MIGTKKRGCWVISNVSWFKYLISPCILKLETNAPSWDHPQDYPELGSLIKPISILTTYLYSQEVEKKIKELQNGTEEMKKEIVQRIAEKKTLGEDLETTRRQITTDKKEYEKLQDELEKLKVSFSKQFC